MAETRLQLSFFLFKEAAARNLACLVSEPNTFDLQKSDFKALHDRFAKIVCFHLTSKIKMKKKQVKIWNFAFD